MTRVGRIFLIAVCSIPFVLNGVNCPGEQNQSAKLTIQTPTLAVTVGAPAKLLITIENTSGKPFEIDKASSQDGQAEAYTNVEVRDTFGNLLPRIDGQTFVKNGKLHTFPKRWMTRKAVAVAPGDNLRDFLVLSNLFDFETPGNYTVTAKLEIRAPGSGPDIKWIEAVSNTIRIEVVR